MLYWIQNSSGLEILRWPRKDGEIMEMKKKELDARELIEQLNRLPDEAKEKVAYIIQGAALIADSRAGKNNNPAA